MYTHACIHVNVCFSIESVDQGFTVIIDNQLGRRKDAKSLLRIIQVIHHLTVTPFFCLRVRRRNSLGYLLHVYAYSVLLFLQCRLYFNTTGIQHYRLLSICPDMVKVAPYFRRLEFWK